MGRVELHHSNIDRAKETAALKWGHKVGRMVTNSAKQKCPVDEGLLRNTIDYTVDTGRERATVTVGTPVHYAKYVHDGTGIHGPHGTPIVPVTAKALKFRYSGPGGSKTTPKEKRGWVFAKSVKGQKPQPFLTDALREVMGIIIERARR